MKQFVWHFRKDERKIEETAMHENVAAMSM